MPRAARRPPPPCTRSSRPPRWNWTAACRIWRRSWISCPNRLPRSTRKCGGSWRRSPARLRARSCGASSRPTRTRSSAVIRETVALLPLAARDVRVHLNPEDARLVRARLAEASSDRAWSIAEDPIIARGGCRVSSENSAIDAQARAARRRGHRGGHGRCAQCHGRGVAVSVPKPRAIRCWRPRHAAGRTARVGARSAECRAATDVAGPPDPHGRV